MIAFRISLILIEKWIDKLSSILADLLSDLVPQLIGVLNLVMFGL